MTTINHINAGIIHTQARMNGLDLAGALHLARHARLLADINAEPHRATVVRLLREMWTRHDTEIARIEANNQASEAFDAAVAAAYPAEWAKAQAKTGRARRDARTDLRKRFRLSQMEK